MTFYFILLTKCINFGANVSKEEHLISNIKIFYHVKLNVKKSFSSKKQHGSYRNDGYSGYSHG